MIVVTFKVLAIKTRELNSLQSDCSAKSNQLENKHAQELTAEKEKALQVSFLIMSILLEIFSLLSPTSHVLHYNI